MKRSQKREKTSNVIFSQKTRENNFTKLTSLMLDFAKKNVGKIADLGLQFPFKKLMVTTDIVLL